MKKTVLATAFVAMMTSAPAHAACADDCWNTPDKPMHFGVSMVIGFAAGQQWPENKWKAFGVAMIPGVLKEIADAQERGNRFSTKDLAADALGAALGVQFGSWAVQFRSDGAVTVGVMVPMK